MTIHNVTTKWVQELAFDAQIDKHTFRMDTSGILSSDTGPSPKKLLLAALAGCTGMDVAALLKKMRVPFTGFELDVEADLTEDLPKVYSEIRLVYRVFGENLDTDKVEKAVKLSEEKYCGVSAMLAKNCPILYSIEYATEA